MREELGFWERRVRELVDTLSVFADRLRCEAVTAKGTQCTRRPWKVRRGRPVCGAHARAKSVDFHFGGRDA